MSCKGCTKRHLGCHSECEDYLAFRKALDESNEKKRKYLEETIYSTYHNRKKEIRNMRKNISNRSGGR